MTVVHSPTQQRLILLLLTILCLSRIAFLTLHKSFKFVSFLTDWYQIDIVICQIWRVKLLALYRLKWKYSIGRAPAVVVSSTTFKGQYLHHRFISSLERSHQLCEIKLCQSVKTHNADEYKSVPNKEIAQTYLKKIRTFFMLHMSFKVTSHSFTILGSVQRCKINLKIYQEKKPSQYQKKPKQANSRFKECWACAFGGEAQARLFGNTLTAEWAEPHTDPSVGSLLPPPKRWTAVGRSEQSQAGCHVEGRWRVLFFFHWHAART